MGRQQNKAGCPHRKRWAERGNKRNELILDGITLAGAQNRVEVRLTGTGDKPCVFDTQGEYADVTEVAQAVRAAYNTVKKDSISLNVRLKVTADGIADF